MLNLPLDINILILSFLPNNNLHYLSDKSMITKKIMKYVLINKYRKKNKKIINGIVNNYFNECFKCSEKMGNLYNIIICYRCNLFTDGYYLYPLICHNCCNKKLRRGELKFTDCDICKYPTTHLGITPFS